MPLLTSLRRRSKAMLRGVLPFRARVAARSLGRRLGRGEGPGLATPSDLRACYRLLLGRDPDQRGELDFLTLIEGGITRDDLIKHFLSSPEFRARQLASGGLNDVALSTVMVDGLVFHLDPSDFAIGPHLSREGDYEPGVLAALRGHLAPGDTFVDVGASFGYFSAQIGRHVGPLGRVVAFEPGPQNQSLLLLNLYANGILGAEVRQMALGNEPGLFVYSRAGANGVISPFGGDARELGNHDLVRVSTLDRELSGHRVHAMKVDAEGAEGLILFGGRSMLQSNRPTVVFEFSPPALEAISNMTGEHVLGLLADLGYSLDVIGSPDERARSRSPREIMDRYGAAPEGHLDLLAWNDG